jgi:hypothetical protein
MSLQMPARLLMTASTVLKMKQSHQGLDLDVHNDI